MVETTRTIEAWPSLPWAEWKDTGETLQLWTQIVGKLKLALCPFLNEWWGVGFEVNARGLATGLIPYEDRALEAQFDFLEHALHVRTSDGRSEVLPLAPRSVAAFYREFMAALSALDVRVAIDTRPAEIPDPVPFDRDEEHDAYDPEYAERWWRVMLGTTRVLQRYRSSFFGKSSPILYYWGSFDLAHARFSGRLAPPMPGMPRFFQIAEHQENAACGFWPGNATLSGLTLGEPAFYAYALPAPDGYAEAAVRPDSAYYHAQLGEFILPYEAVRTADDPDGAILEFFQSTYAAAASLSRWEELPSPLR